MCTSIELPGAGVLLRNARLPDGRPPSFSSSGSITGASGLGYHSDGGDGDDDDDDEHEDVCRDMTDG